MGALKISELIGKLDAILKAHGNLDVVIDFDKNGYFNAIYTSVEVDPETHEHVANIISSSEV